MKKKISDKYKKLYSGKPELFKLEYKWVWENLIDNGSILVVGCSDNNLANVLVKLGYDVYGVDYRKTDNPKYNYYKCDIRETPFESEFFDQIISLHYIEHVGMNAFGNTWIDYAYGDRMAILEIYRILKKGGMVLASFSCANALKTLHRRYYNKYMLEYLFHGFKYQITYFKRDKNKWRMIDGEEISYLPFGITEPLPAVALVKAVR